MELIKTNLLTGTQFNNVENFLATCKFNSEIKFTENNINYYDDFTCFYIFHENNCIKAFASCFVPDEACCEIYFHIGNGDLTNHSKIFDQFILALNNELNKFDIKNTYFLFDNNTEIPDYMLNKMSFLHSECLMQYELSHTFDMDAMTLSFSKTIDENNIIINTFLEDISVGSCKIEFSNDYALIHDVVIDEKYRGFGYGTQTLKVTIDILKEMNFTNILLHVNSANTPAFAMYSHHGFLIKQKIDYWNLI